MDETTLLNKLNLLLPYLDERQRRLLLAAEARALGHGGISLIAKVAKVTRPTIYRGLRELEQGSREQMATGRIRLAGGGRKKVTEKDPELLPALERLIAPYTRGNPESPLCWTSKSTRQLAKILSEQGHSVSHRLVGKILKDQGYSLQGLAKTREGSQHPDRDTQFLYIARWAQRFLRWGLPVISVDTKKKELVGNFKNAGHEWQPKGKPEQVRVHDFQDKELGKAVPYGIYDIGRNEGWVSVGSDHDTAAFAVETLSRWWRMMGSLNYPKARHLLICADGGGSNGSRTRLWKAELQYFANKTQLIVTVCHLPPGTSKWNKIEHCMFSYITLNWRGRPLVSHEAIVQLIRNTTTEKGLRIQAELDLNIYPTKIKVNAEEMNLLNLRRHKFHGDWNYTIYPVVADHDM